MSIPAGVIPTREIKSKFDELQVKMRQRKYSPSQELTRLMDR